MYPPDILEALKDALSSVYWYKRQMRSFMENARVPTSIILQQRWADPQEYKAIIADKVINALAKMDDDGIEAIRELNRRLIEMKDFSHLLKEDDGKRLKKIAEVNVERLRQLIIEHDTKLRKEQQEELNRKKAREQLEDRASRFRTLESLKTKYFSLFSATKAQKRGLEFESFLFDLFNAFDLSPRGSFSITGEQIDGAFELDGYHFLVEAKWEKEKIGAREIRSFKEQIESKLDNTLGLFISVLGFTNEGISAVQRTRPNLILMDGQELIPVLDYITDLRELLHRKIRHAAQTGEIYWRYTED